MSKRRCFAPLAWLPDGWARDVTFSIDERGRFGDVRAGASSADAASGATHVDGIMLPGMINAHSHAFQRAMVGLTHRAGPASDDFWSWRNLMYSLALRLDPEQIETIATWAYVEMLRGGYTHVCEFHYLHNDGDGRPYADRAELSAAVLRAAKTAGIGITLLPVLYVSAGFGGLPPRDDQRRFITSPAQLIDTIRALGETHRGDPLVAFGLAPHSLRAVPSSALEEAVSGLHAIDAHAPIHIHIAEQMGEVDACVQWSGQRPVEWLLNHQRVDACWNLVHATHMTADETRRAAATGAVAVVCATTEADLGDGIFDLPAWRSAGGRLAIGTDSQVSRDLWSELRMLEYSQRLALRARNVAAAPGASSGERLFASALEGGAAASGLALGRIESGARADWLVVSKDKLAFAGRSTAAYLDSLIFDHHAAQFADVVVAGRSLGADLRGDPSRIARDRFVKVLKALAA